MYKTVYSRIDAISVIENINYLSFNQDDDLLLKNIFKQYPDLFLYYCQCNHKVNHQKISHYLKTIPAIVAYLPSNYYSKKDDLFSLLSITPKILHYCDAVLLQEKEIIEYLTNK